jgi:DivIVA domain-containing protein
MPLTAEDVSNKRFTPVRLREGYDMGEVDQFLDEVQLEIERLNRENNDLRSKLAAAQNGAMSSAPPMYEEPAREFYSAPAPVFTPEPEPEPMPEPVSYAPPVQSYESVRAETVHDASSHAARLLEVASKAADNAVEEAKNEADRIVSEARTKAERLELESRTLADRAEAEARGRAAMLEQETADRRRNLLTDLEREREKLAAEIEGLRSFEREYRARLKSYFKQQLDSLETTTSAPMTGQMPMASSQMPMASNDSMAPTRLRSILGDES